MRGADLAHELQDTPIVVAGKLVHELAILAQQDGRHVAGGVFGRIERVKVADGKLGLTLELVVAERRREFARVAAASPRGGQIDHRLAARRQQRLEVRARLEVGHGALGQ